MMLLVCPEIYTENGRLDGYLLVNGAKVEALAPGPVPPELAGIPRIDLPNCRIIPGLIDMHIHGAGGWPVEGADAAGLQRLAQYLAAHGVTGFLPTASARPLTELTALAQAVREAMQEAPNGAAILGLHLEGPFLNPAQKGAMNPDHFRTPSIAEMEQLLATSGETIRRVTLAPELPGAPALIRFLSERSIAVAGGHTAATYDETCRGIEAGVRIANHTYNAMRGLHHRELGALGAYLLDDRVTCEVIGDLLHVHPAAIHLLLRVVGYARVALISDAIPAAGMPPGRYRMFGRDVFIDAEGYSRLADGTIAGSTRLLLHGLRNLVERLRVPWSEAVHMASLNPARALGLSDRKGSLAPGKDADLVVLGPDWTVRWTIVEGRVVRRPGDPAPELNPVYEAARSEG